VSNSKAVASVTAFFVICQGQQIWPIRQRSESLNFAYINDLHVCVHEPDCFIMKLFGPFFWIASLCLAMVTLCLTQSGCQRDTTADGLAKVDAGKNGVEIPHKEKVDSPPNPFRFVEIAEAAGVNFTYHNGQEANEYTILETLGGGVASFDFDRDGWMDLFFTGGGTMENKALQSLGPGLFHNQGKMKFANVTENAFAIKGKYYSHGTIVGDYDNDGFADVLVTGYGGVQFLRNQGDGTFLESQLEGIDETQWSTSAAWADLNGDQLLDLYIAHYVNWSWDNNIFCGTEQSRDVCSPRRFTGLKDAVYFSNGDGTFRNASETAGLVDKGNGLGVIIGDFDQDRDMDIYVANDTTDNFLYINDGKGNLVERGRELGVALGGIGVPDGSMGVDMCDFNNDGKFDLWVANFEAESFALYRNQNAGLFLHVSETMGVTRLGGAFVGFGTAWADWDFDGDEDVIVTNGHVLYLSKSAPMRQHALLLRNDGTRINRIFFAPNEYLGQTHVGRGLVATDLDNDGDLDVVISHINDPVAVLENQVQRLGDWLAVELIGTKSNRFGIGTTLTLETDKGNFVRHAKGGSSFLSSQDPRIYFGIPQGAKIKQLKIVWPIGSEETVTGLESNQQVTVVESNHEKS
jgi:hypothetical protein